MQPLERNKKTQNIMLALCWVILIAAFIFYCFDFYWFW
ncbi:hypothetical protein BN4901_0253 [Citrobacter europaeus]|uniref:Uncharacterized protein n=1 Tax=Citrobacter europaeus TaxID=1914243 RepID=A0ABY0JKV5_9ENTR|nr:hypothetical protein CIP106467_2519 [Citrobacter europaeus]SBW23515.1 hypothetical protein BN4901_0253 [Citrobacter europaeus]